jgi:hypothetical protein
LTAVTANSSVQQPDFPESWAEWLPAAAVHSEAAAGTSNAAAVIDHRRGFLANLWRPTVKDDTGPSANVLNCLAKKSKPNSGAGAAGAVRLGFGGPRRMLRRK